MRFARAATPFCSTGIFFLEWMISSSRRCRDEMGSWRQRLKKSAIRAATHQIELWAQISCSRLASSERSPARVSDREQLLRWRTQLPGSCLVADRLPTGTAPLLAPGAAASAPKMAMTPENARARQQERSLAAGLDSW